MLVISTQKIKEFQSVWLKTLNNWSIDKTSLWSLIWWSLVQPRREQEHPFFSKKPWLTLPLNLFLSPKLIIHSRLRGPFTLLSKRKKTTSKRSKRWYQAVYSSRRCLCQKRKSQTSQTIFLWCAKTTILTVSQGQGNTRSAECYDCTTLSTTHHHTDILW